MNSDKHAQTSTAVRQLMGWGGAITCKFVHTDGAVGLLQSNKQSNSFFHEKLPNPLKFFYFAISMQGSEAAALWSNPHNESSIWPIMSEHGYPSLIDCYILYQEAKPFFVHSFESSQASLGLEDLLFPPNNSYHSYPSPRSLTLWIMAYRYSLCLCPKS